MKVSDCMCGSQLSTGKTKDGKDVSGSISVPEVTHDTEEDEFVVCHYQAPLNTTVASA